MKITELHLQFYRQKKCRPRFLNNVKTYSGKAFVEVPVNVNQLINSQIEEKKNLSCGNAISLLLSVRKTIERENYRKYKNYLSDYNYSSLSEYMEKTNCPIRSKHFKRWLRRLRTPGHSG
jgi:hypothetical protein